MIQLGVHALNKAVRAGAKGRFLLEAAIAAQHCLAPSLEQTNWPLIYRLYQQLEVVQPSPFVQLNRIIAQLYAQGPVAAPEPLLALEKHPFLRNHHLLQLTMAKTWLLLGSRTHATTHTSRRWPVPP